MYMSVCVPVCVQLAEKGQYSGLLLLFKKVYLGREPVSGKYFCLTTFLSWSINNLSEDRIWMFHQEKVIYI